MSRLGKVSFCRMNVILEWHTEEDDKGLSDMLGITASSTLSSLLPRKMADSDS